ncbi:MAG: hypothetical protein CVU56_07330 [Deltaproteobacteria bacterium HGW-Deltaproteobacteria-14]|jgi:hypothetical protein|nr:MAG: hypothetical protein CVU56_07330 [Deltaproteobacteria bacterium HGW-Deltaproteobacteria-14]
MRLAHHALLGSIVLATALVTACQRRAAAPVAEADAATAPNAGVAPTGVVAAPSKTEQAPPAAAMTPEVAGRTLDVAKTLGIVLTSNVMGEIEPCG